MDKSKAYVFPEFSGFKLQSYELFSQNLSLGHCNKNITCHMINQPDDVIIVRVYNSMMLEAFGEDVKKSVRFAHDQKLGPTQLLTFTNGVCLLYIHGTTISWANTSLLLDDVHNK